jgi:4-alpha-glucanotransferase
MATDAWGIEDGYHDIRGEWHETSPATRRQLRVAMGGLGDVEDPPPQTRPVWFVRYGSAAQINRPAELELEDGTHLKAVDRLPPDLPLGYHDLHPDDGGATTRLIVTPDRCHLGNRERSWGWTVQLYATRSSHSWGIGDLADLQTLARWSADLGAGYVAVNPLHAPRPAPDPEPSPYFPSSRRFRNPLYLRIEEVPGFDPGDRVLTDAAAAGRALNASRVIHRDQVQALKRGALDRLWASFDADARFDRYVDEQGVALRQYAIYCALAEAHGSGWSRWPSELRRVDSPGVERFAAASEQRLRFHSWIQWLLDEQLARAGRELPLLGDLAIGVDPDGADAWVWRDVLAPGVRIGAPPDAFNLSGQDWGLPPFVPWRLRALGYEPIVQTIRAALRHTGALRIDHVMGLFRLFWIPDGCTAEAGTYVRYPGTDLLDIVALESARAGAEIVGEDLGTVEDEVRAHLAERAVLSCRVVWFEHDPPESFPVQALASVSTHDLPTIPGVWTGADLADQERAGIDPNEEGLAAHRQCLEELTGLGPDAPVADVVLATYRRLACAPSRIRVASLEDALQVEERPNVPGTTVERPNWSLALPVPVDAIIDDPAVRAVAATMAAPDRATST